LDQIRVPSLDTGTTLVGLTALDCGSERQDPHVWVVQRDQAVEVACVERVVQLYDASGCAFGISSRGQWANRSPRARSTGRALGLSIRIVGRAASGGAQQAPRMDRRPDHAADALVGFHHGPGSLMLLGTAAPKPSLADSPTRPGWSR